MQVSYVLYIVTESVVDDKYAKIPKYTSTWSFFL